jgi:hypothetical protein
MSVGGATVLKSVSREYKAVFWYRTDIVAWKDCVELGNTVGIGELDATVQTVSTMENTRWNEVKQFSPQIGRVVAA